MMIADLTAFLPEYNSKSCPCLERELALQLEDWPGQQGCLFRVPPDTFDPTRASAHELSIWGSLQDEASLLQTSSFGIPICSTSGTV
jgi:hypothetical protein